MFIYPFNKYLPGAYYEPGTILGAWGASVNKDFYPIVSSNSERTNLNSKHKKIV